jgi:transposase InsO family protein
VSNDALLAHIKAIHTQVKGEYGWPRMWKELLTQGVRVGKERVRKLMAQHGIRARHKRKYIATTNSNHDLPVAPNLLERNFAANAPNQVWTTDITYLATAVDGAGDPHKSGGVRLTAALHRHRRR